jgi:hypothetical protein
LFSSDNSCCPAAFPSLCWFLTAQVALKGLIVTFIWVIGEDRDHDAEAEYAERVLGEAFTVKMCFHHPVQGL